MSVQQSSVPAASSLRRFRWVVAVGVVLLVGMGVGLLVRLLRDTGSPRVRAASAVARPVVSWLSGAKPARDFRLTDQAGQPVSLQRFRGRPVMLTFIDPLCRNLCPLEAKVLDSVEAKLPAAQRPAIVAVSVNQWGNARRNLLTDFAKWRLTSMWHWAVGAPASLRRVWKNYGIGVEDAPKTIAGVTVHNITHTEATYLIDGNGDERALFLYPFRAADVVHAVRQLAGA